MLTILLRLMFSSSWPAFPTENNKQLREAADKQREMAPFFSSCFSYHVPLLSFVTIFTHAGWKSHKTFALGTRHILSFLIISTVVRENEWHWALACNPRSHHVDSIFIEWVPACAFGIVHQNLWLEGPPNGALLKGLTWKTHARREKKKMLLHYRISTEWSLAFITAETEFITRWKGQNRGCHKMTAALIYEKAWTERPCLTHAGKKKKSQSAAKREKPFQRLCNSAHYHKDGLGKQYNTPHPWHSAVEIS